MKKRGLMPHLILIYLHNNNDYIIIEHIYERHRRTHETRPRCSGHETSSFLHGDGEESILVFPPISDHCPKSIWPHDALGTSNMHKLLYFCSSWFLVRTCSLNEASCCCCSSGLVSMPGMLEICSRASWILVLSLFSSWWMSWLSLSMLGAKTTNTKTQTVMT